MRDTVLEAKGRYTGELAAESRILMANHRLCLCWHCQRFNPSNREENCSIANKLYSTCVECDLVTPVARCPQFLPDEETASYASQIKK